MNTTRRHNRVLEIIQERLVPDDVAKKARGEVFTPLDLVREMLFGLRKSALAKGKNEVWGIDMSGNFIDESEDNRLGGIPLHIWRDSESTILDPANGIGNFPVVAFSMLDYQLGKHGKDKKYRGDVNKDKRRKHIVEKMLFMIEIDKGNVNTARKIFKNLVPNATPNVCCADTLKLTDEKLRKEFGTDKFIVIMGNPPFNESLENNPVGHAQDTALWESFVEKSFKMLKNTSSFISFLHPARWRQPGHILHDLLFSHKFIYLSIHSKKEGANKFGAVTRFDYYVIQNIAAEGKTPTRFEDKTHSNITINKSIKFIANFGQDIWESIHKLKANSLNVIGGGSKIKYGKNDHANEEKCPTSKPFLNVNTTAKTSKVPKGATYKKATKKSDGNNIYVDFVCSSNEHDIRKTKKVIFSKNEVVYPFYDSGEYGLTSNAFAIPVDNENDGRSIVTYLNSKLIKYLIASVKFGNFSTAKNIFDFIPDITKLTKVSLNDTSILKQFHFNEDQVDRINKYKESDTLGDQDKMGGYLSKTRKVRHS